MSVLATDNFNRADGTIGANWTTVTGLQTPNVHSNAAMNGGNWTIPSGAFYNAATAPDDQYAKVTLVTLTATTDEGPGPAVRWSAAAQTGYFVQCNTTEIRLYKVVAGSFTQLGTNGPAAALNDVIELDVQGASLTVKQNGSSIITATDSAIASGQFGIWIVSTAAASNVGLDDWEGGDFGVDRARAYRNLTRDGLRPAIFRPGLAR